MTTAKRALDVALALIGGVLAAPLVGIGMIGIRLSSAGPLIYRAHRAGRDGRPFTMYKLRTMHVDHGAYRSAVTADGDPRVFPFGAWLRRTKIDELPQLLNVLRGEMSIIGPRPEEPRIVAEHYAPVHLETLRVPPGMASPGSIYSYTHGETLLGADNPEGHYLRRLLPIKLAMDVVYVRHASLSYDVAIMGRAAWVIVAGALGRRRFAEPPETAPARLLCGDGLRQADAALDAASRCAPAAHV